MRITQLGDVGQRARRHLDLDRLLHDFRRNAGLASTAKPYGGWMAAENSAGCGQFVGHSLSACALMCASTRKERLKEDYSWQSKMNRPVARSRPG